VITASLMCWPRYFSASTLSFLMIRAEKLLGGERLAIEFAPELVLRLAHFALYEVDNFLRLRD